MQTFKFDNGDELIFEPFVDGNQVGFKITKIDPTSWAGPIKENEVRYLIFNPSTEGDSPDVFVYLGKSRDIEQNSIECYIPIEFDLKEKP